MTDRVAVAGPPQSFTPFLLRWYLLRRSHWLDFFVAYLYTSFLCACYDLVFVVSTMVDDVTPHLRSAAGWWVVSAAPDAPYQVG